MPDNTPKPMGSCPYCAEEISLEASLCKHCESSLSSFPKEALCVNHKYELGKCLKCGVTSPNAPKYKAMRQELRVKKPAENSTPPEPMQNLPRCKKCGATYLTAQKQGFGLGKAVAGGVLTGGVGLLAGFIGSRKVKVSCLRCGHSWKPGM